MTRKSYADSQVVIYLPRLTRGNFREETMSIGVIGTGHLGGSLTSRLTAAGHIVSVANSRGPESLAEFSAETCAKPVTVKGAARAGEIVIITIPQRTVPDFPNDLLDGVDAGVVVVDTGNYYPRTMVSPQSLSNPALNTESA